MGIIDAITPVTQAPGKPIPKLRGATAEEIAKVGRINIEFFQDPSRYPTYNVSATICTHISRRSNITTIRDVEDIFAPTIPQAIMVWHDADATPWQVPW